jgi:hypothetical protein
MSSQNQLSRWGAISRTSPELAPGAKLFLVADSDDTTVGPANLAAEFPVDNDGVVRVYTTPQAANNAAATNRGDVVAILPGYNQSLGGADSWNTAGVQFIGYGNGTNRPTITYTAAGSTVALGANGIRVSNLRFVASVTGVTRALSMDTGFTGQRVDNNVFTFDTNGDDFVTSIRMASKESVIEDNRLLYEIDTSGPRQGIAFLGGEADRSIIRNNLIMGQFDTIGDTSNSFGAISMDTSDTSDTNLNGLIVQGNTIYSGDTAATVGMRIAGGGIRVRAALFDNRIAAQDTAASDSNLITLGEAISVQNWVRTGDSDLTEVLAGPILKFGGIQST